jgi:hypothetical protein
MGEIQFSQNFQDLSVSHGVNAGFQFQFYCQHCNDAFRSEFVPFTTGRASGWLSRASGLLGSLGGNVGQAVDGLASAGWGGAHDKAFVAAIEQAKKHFHRCARCSQYVCDRCWNEQKGLCRSCAPSAEIEIEAARAAGEVHAAGEKAALEGIQRGKKLDVKRDRQLVCPQCGAETKGAKFCPECGTKMAVNANCPKCSAEVSPQAKFCPECGEKMIA